ncbi:MAG: Ig-like domain-containing protein, partial [Cyclobacteriaceae bacterium]
EVNPNFNISAKEASIESVSNCEYWLLNQSVGSAEAQVTLHWGAGSCETTSVPAIVVGAWSGSEWVNASSSATTGDSNAGTVRSGIMVNQFNAFTIAMQEVVNQQPVAENDEFDTPNNVTLNGNVLLNDSDPDSDDLIVNTTPATAPEHGLLSLNVDGTFSYTPTANYIGEDSFVYEVCDNGAPSLCATATVTITVTSSNQAPVAMDNVFETPINTLLNGNVMLNDTDPDGDDLLVNTTPVTLPMHGDLVLESDGTFTYTPDQDFTGEDDFTYQVCDNGAPSLCAEAEVRITVLEGSTELIIYEGISPDGDGKNDEWKIINIDKYPDNVVRIFNRWGSLVYETKGYNNTDRVWKGESMIDGGIVANGTYFYIIDLGNGHKKLNGYIVTNK